MEENLQWQPSSSASGSQHDPSSPPLSSGSGHAQSSDAPAAKPAVKVKSIAKISKSLKYILYSTYDDWSRQQDNSPASWLAKLESSLIANGIVPDQVVPLLRAEHLGSTTACTMASWLGANSNSSWTSFKAAFLQRHPSKPPLVTRNSWKALSMHSEGSYHAYLTEFNRQEALIRTGADEKLEAFLHGLSQDLRSQVEFLKGRLWKPSELDRLIKITTERVNCQAIQQVQPLAGHVSKGQKKRKLPYTRTDKSESFAGPKTPKKQAPKAGKPAYVGKNPRESRAISNYCFFNNICKYCRSGGHASTECTQQSAPPSFSKPTHWDETHWFNFKRPAPPAAAPKKGPGGKRPKNF